jgi:predicted enzyme related to lactoylglutathione lyase
MKAKLESINLVSAKPGELRDFYVNVLNFEEDEQWSHPPGFYLIKGGNGCNILIQQNGNAETKPGSSDFEIGIEVESFEEYYSQIKESGCKIIADKQQMGWGTGAAIADTEGHIINIYEYRH